VDILFALLLGKCGNLAGLLLDLACNLKLKPLCYSRFYDDNYFYKDKKQYDLIQKNFFFKAN
jgi:hypothetical protein